ncbi:4-diphosphocytidyl-2-C-methyl-D-erythritol kinase [Candidatus Kinetoplastibacterium sorsogonicusi]|uniref:4-diphosphocytidyl-2-C-methyl-D-erythritol kinase n=1 Tax=Candidatus Kinetoplastidibacterium kentomonadis TaxID=1576550 RepID=A0A3S7J997_9PROT|nr:4-(cytidine 5'-diphospho)-2-C-methyl-D-erythritol kinase [Candidatus Kinetoplastibacterium sorsogonicusi]AWD32239.1 4-diphosphocytidyl-2-C-methyl-D-erythritol kinase [Candidatus Kinetoplastibacterium sorsogonicusi]
MLYDIPAPAKINLFLHIIGRRNDGYHELQTVFKLVNLNDYISFDVSLNGSITRDINKNTNISMMDDLTVKAAYLLRQITGTKKGVYINIKKHIPMQSGLGGGSSDAATTLIVLNKLWALNLSRIELMKIGLKLGADIPFFIFGQSAFAGGIGEILNHINLPKKIYLLFKPSIDISTKKIFEIYHFYNKIYTNKIDKKIFIYNYQTNNFVGKNDFENLILIKYPNFLKIYDKIVNIGINIRMTGSGSCFFSEFDNISDAILAKTKIEDIINDKEHNFMYICSSLDKHPLFNWMN